MVLAKNRIFFFFYSITFFKQSDHSDHHHATPTRKRSILVNGNQTPHLDNDSINSHQIHLNNGMIARGSSLRQLNTKSLSIFNLQCLGLFTDLNMKTRQYLNQPSVQSANAPNDSALEQSWIFAFCIRCRGEDKGPSWEPPYWQKCCPYPLCPSFRQCARMLCIVLIGKNLREQFN